MRRYNFIPIYVSGIITQIAKETDIPGFSVGVIQTFFPDESDNMTERQEKEWVDSNNKRMLAICNFLNTVQL